MHPFRPVPWKLSDPKAVTQPNTGLFRRDIYKISSQRITRRTPPSDVKLSEVASELQVLFVQIERKRLVRSNLSEQSYAFDEF